MYEVLPQSGMERMLGGLRAQLQTMMAATYALEAHLDGNEKAAEYLAVMDRAICAQLRLILQAELGQRLYSEDEMRVVLAPTDLAALGRDVMKKADALTRPLLDIKAEFSSTLAALPTQADRAALEKMLLAFISNSVRAIGRSGTIRLELERQRDQAVFTMTDTGGGLDPDALAGLFEPEDPDRETNGETDEEAEPEQAPEVPARGLLLARQIARLHGGTLVAGNTEAGGACLAVSLPIVEKAESILRSPPPSVDGGGWDPVLVSLSDCLPLEAFLPDRRKR